MNEPILTPEQEKKVLYWFSIGADDFGVSIETEIPYETICAWHKSILLVDCGDGMNPIEYARRLHNWGKTRDAILAKEKAVQKVRELNEVKDAQWYVTHDKELKKDWSERTEHTGANGAELANKILVEFLGDKPKVDIT